MSSRWTTNPARSMSGDSLAAAHAASMSEARTTQSRQQLIDLAGTFALHRRCKRLARPSFDHLVRPQQQRLRGREAKGFRGLEVDDQLELRGLLDGEVCGFDSFEDFIHVGCCTVVHGGNVGAIGDKPARLYIFAQCVHGWQTNALTQSDEACPREICEGRWQHDQPAGSLACR